VKEHNLNVDRTMALTEGEEQGAGASMPMALPVMMDNGAATVGQSFLNIATVRGDSLRIEVNLQTDTVKAIMTKIEEELGIRTYNQSLSILGNALIDTDGLCACGVKTEDEISVVDNGLTYREAIKAGLVYKGLVRRRVATKMGVYEGQWKNGSFLFLGGKEQGEGIMTYADGNTYEGQWEAGKAQGEGIMTYANGNTYDGQWENNHPHGEGTMTYPVHIIVIAGQEPGEPQHCMMGVYVLMEGQLVGGRCVWQREGAGLEAYIYYAARGGWWVVGGCKADMESGASAGRIRVISDAMTPDAAAEQWGVADGTAWLDAPQITASTCTEDERQAMVRQAE
jgi:hypothetical protein